VHDADGLRAQGCEDAAVRPIALVSGGTRSLRAYASDPWWGHLIVPGAGNVVPDDGRLWAADNGAFKAFDADRFLAMIERVSRSPRCLFVTVPDVVSDAPATCEQWREWRPRLSAYRLPLAFVLQDGIEPRAVPWDEAAAIFVGGSTGFKLGRDVRALVAEARNRGKWVHMGRVNTRRRLRYAAHVGCHSVDGTGFSRWGDARLPLLSKWMNELTQPSLMRELMTACALRAAKEGR
jgi:hypothetical protein